MLEDKDRIFTNVYGFQDWGIDAAIKRGDCPGAVAVDVVVGLEPVDVEHVGRRVVIDPFVRGLQLAVYVLQQRDEVGPQQEGIAARNAVDRIGQIGEAA